MTRGCVNGAWSLGFGHSLAIGHWSLVIPHPAHVVSCIPSPSEPKSNGADRQNIREEEDAQRAEPPGASAGGDPAREAARPPLQEDRPDHAGQAEDLPAGRGAESPG